MNNAKYKIDINEMNEKKITRWEIKWYVIIKEASRVNAKILVCINKVLGIENLTILEILDGVYYLPYNL